MYKIMIEIGGAYFPCVVDDYSGDTGFEYTFNTDDELLNDVLLENFDKQTQQQLNEHFEQKNKEMIEYRKGL